MRQTRHMNNITREILKSKLKSLYGDNFQGAVDRIFLIIYDCGEFTRVKQKHDQGSDGILNNQTVLACYSPEQYILSKFKSKIDGDYKSYTKNWAPTHSGWTVVTNLELTAAMLKHVQKLHAKSEIICIEKLLELINKQSWSKKALIFDALEIDKQYIVYDALEEAVNDLIKNSDENTAFKPYTSPVYIETKIEINLSEESIEVFAVEYSEALSLFSIVEAVMNAQNTINANAIRSKIKKTYGLLGGAFDEKIDSMVKILSKEKENDDYYTNHMRVLIIYFFEQCLFGLKAEGEVST